MKYFVAEDEFYYTKRGREVLKKEHPELSRFIKFPTFETIQKILEKDPATLSDMAFIAPYLPRHIHPSLAGGGIFEVFTLRNRHGILTTGQHRAGIPMERVVQEKLGVNIRESPFTMKDYAGAEALHERVELVKHRILYRRPTKGFMLTGIPGTGKSFFAECLAGELGYLMVQLNLVKFMERPNPIQAIDMFFDFFSKNPGNYLVWIDEIEKMFVSESSQEIMGILLTRMNEAGREDGKEAARFFTVATANNISLLSERNPEFFRPGRFDEVIFLQNPTEENAKAIFSLYHKKEAEAAIAKGLPVAIENHFGGKGGGGIRIARAAEDFVREKGLKSAEEGLALLDRMEKEEKLEWMRPYFPDVDVNYLVRISMALYRDENQMPSRYIYTPAEIRYVIEGIWERWLYGMAEDLEKVVKEVIDKIRPLQATMKSGMQELKSAGYYLLKI